MERIIGTEVEYGISAPGDRTANPIMTSTQAVLAYAAAAKVPRRFQKTAEPVARPPAADGSASPP